MINAFTVCGRNFKIADREYLFYPLAPITSVTCKKCKKTDAYKEAKALGFKVHVCGKGRDI
jgi:hypothetical protein